MSEVIAKLLAAYGMAVRADQDGIAEEVGDAIVLLVEGMEKPGKVMRGPIAVTNPVTMPTSDWCKVMRQSHAEGYPTSTLVEAGGEAAS